MLPLKVESLTLPSQSLTIGQHHRDILQEKLAEFTKFLHHRRVQLEEEYRTFAQRNDIDHNSPEGKSQNPPEIGYDMRKHLQEELEILRRICQQRLDYLFHKFEMEWKLDPREKSTKFPMPKSGTEAIYLGEQLGEALGRGLAEICVQRPNDPIEYLALWLKKYSDNMRQQQQDAVLSLKLRLVEEEALVIREQQELLAREREQIKEDEERRRRMFLEQARQVEESKQAAGKLKSQIKNPDSEQDKDDEEHLVSATKRVTLVEPETSTNLYTIEEKDSVNGVVDELESKEDMSQ